MEITPENLPTLRGKVVQFTKLIEEGEYGFDEGMIARIVDFGLEQEGTEYEHFWIMFEFGDYFEHNKSKMRPNYYDNNGVACLTWFESGMYPKNHRDKCYLDYNRHLFDVIEDPALKIAVYPWAALSPAQLSEKLTELGIVNTVIPSEDEKHMDEIQIRGNEKTIFDLRHHFDVMIMNREDGDTVYLDSKGKRFTQR